MEAEPPKLHELKNAIPNTLFVPVLWKSMSYVIMDVAIIVGVFQIAVWLELHSIFIESYHSSSFWSKLWASLGFWFAQGTMFWAIFVLGHDCGHGSFSSSKRINYFMGHLLMMNLIPS
jgi:omega-3 fatty acid desaturase (delta-15 desaturase)